MTQTEVRLDSEVQEDKTKEDALIGILFRIRRLLCGYVRRRLTADIKRKEAERVLDQSTVGGDGDAALL